MALEGYKGGRRNQPEGMRKVWFRSRDRIGTQRVSLEVSAERGDMLGSEPRCFWSSRVVRLPLVSAVLPQIFVVKLVSPVRRDDCRFGTVAAFGLLTQSGMEFF